MILYNKTEEELNQEALELLSHTDITNVKPGSRARTLLAIVNKLLASYYRVLDFNLTMAFVSKAKDDFLNLIGELVNCRRMPGEDDDNYRYRIVHQVYTVAGANETAIRLAALSVENVVDVVLTPWVFGTGSFAVHVVTSTMDQLDAAVAGVQEVLNEYEAYGVKGVALAPDVLKLGIKLSIVFANGVQDVSKPAIIADVKRAIRTYVNDLAMGEELVLSSLVQIARNTGSSSIVDVMITSLSVDGKPVLLANYKPYWDEKLYIESYNDVQVA